MARTPTKRTGTREVRSDLEQIIARLEQLGATTDEIEALVARWDVLDDDWTVERRRAFVRANDVDLLDELVDVRVEHAGHVVTADPEAVLIQAGLIIGSSVPAIVQWVGDDPARRRAVLDVEQARPDPRRTLLARLA